jgi:tetratricopeptide (TPR) repeat protein
MVRFGSTLRVIAAASLLAAGALAIGSAVSAPTTDTLSEKPKDTDTASHFRNGKTYLESGQLDPAITEFAKVLAVTPGDALTNYYMGLAHLGKNENQEAKNYLAKSVLIDGENPAAREQLGLVSLKLDDRQRAEQQRDALADMMKKCGTSCDEKLTTAFNSLDSALKGGPAGKGKTSSLMMERGQTGDVTYKLAVAEINEGHYQKAIDALKDAENQIGPHPDILNYLGYANRKLGHYDTAIRYYREALAINPDHLGANEYLGELYAEIGDLDRARLQLATLDRLCAFGCAQHEDLKHWIQSASAK